jgi:exoribonuclease-2
VKLGEIDEISLDVGGTVIARLDAPDGEDSDGMVDADEEDDSEELNTALPLAIAIDVTDVGVDNTASATPTPESMAS